MELILELKKEYAAVTGTEDVTTIVDGIETVITVDVYDWTPALAVAATEVQALNQLIDEPDIACNPEAMTMVDGVWVGDITGFLGDLNTPPTVDGLVTVAIDGYYSLWLSRLPAMPTSFTFVLGSPAGVGTII